MTDEKTAIAKIEPPPKLALARTLESAGPNQLVHIDRKGQVRSPVRFRALQAAVLGLSAAVLGVAGVLYYSLLGGAGIGLIVAIALFAGVMPFLGALGARKGLRLLLDKRFDEAA